MRRPCSLIRTTIAAALLAGALPGSPALGAEPPALAFEASEQLAPLSRRLAALPPERLTALVRLVGLDGPGAPIRVILAAEGSPEAADTPPWVAGYAYGALGTVVLLAERVPTYPDASLEEVLRHEIAHVLLARAAGGRRVPRWFNEGVATVAAGGWGLDDRSHLTFALIFRDRVGLAELESWFTGGRRDVARAYALAGAFSREIVRRFGKEATPRILRRVAHGRSFPDAFRDATGVGLRSFEDAFWRRYSLWYRWLPIVGSSATLWTLIALLAALAARRKRKQRTALEEGWEVEEEGEPTVN